MCARLQFGLYIRVAIGIDVFVQDECTWLQMGSRTGVSFTVALRPHYSNVKRFIRRQLLFDLFRCMLTTYKREYAPFLQASLRREG